MNQDFTNPWPNNQTFADSVQTSLDRRQTSSLEFDIYDSSAEIETTNYSDPIQQLTSQDFQKFKQLYVIENFVKRVLKSKQPAYRITVDKFNNRRPQPTLLGRNCHNYLPGFSEEELRNAVSYKRLSPYVELYFSELRKIGYPIQAPYFSLPNGNLEADRTNAFVEAIRQEAKQATFKKEVRRRKEQANENHKSFTQYEHYLFKGHARLSVIRLDLTYKKDSKHGISLPDAIKHKDRLLNNIRKNGPFKNTLVGYAMSLEYGHKKGGYHFHAFFFFDGSKCQHDINIAAQIGRYWSENITDGEGWFFNCNRNKHNYINCGIGTINHGDKEKRQYLLDAARYITKKGMFFEITPPDSSMKKFRTFFRGEIKPIDKKLGRKRKELEQQSVEPSEQIPAQPLPYTPSFERWDRV